MANARFEILIAAEIQKANEAMFRLNLGDSHGHARLKGLREGLELAANLSKAAAKHDDEAEMMS